MSDLKPAVQVGDKMYYVGDDPLNPAAFHVCESSVDAVVDGVPFHRMGNTMYAIISSSPTPDAAWRTALAKAHDAADAALHRYTRLEAAYAALADARTAGGDAP